MEEVDKQAICLDDVQISSLRLGSGNLIPKYFGMPHNPLDGMRQIANDLFAGQNDPCCVYRCTFHYPDGETEQLYGLTLGGLGQFARVPDDIKRWKAKHAWLMHWATRLLPLETTNTLQYINSSVRRTIRCIAWPGQVEWVEVRHAGRCEQFRLLAGMLLNFDFPQLPIHGGCDIDEPRLVLCCIPYEGRRQTLWTLANWRNLDRRIRKYEVTRERPIEILFPDNDSTILALDEDTFMAPARIGFEVAGLVKFVTGTSFSHRTRLDDLLPVAHSVSAISTEESR
jgi:hypothetical protein